MPTNKVSNKEPLRKKAEKLLSEPFPPVHNVGEADPRKLVHELQVHRIELEMQNEELRRAQEEIEASRQKYSDLYDFAPIGYFTFSASGEVLEVNLTGASLLNVERAKLINTPFSVFVEPELRSHFRDYCRNLLSTDKTERCELKLIRNDGKSFNVSLQGISLRYDNTLIIRCAVSDITELKGTQKELKQLNAELEDRIWQRTADLETSNQELKEEVSGRKQAEKALRESEERFRVAQELSPDGFTILHPVRDSQGRIIDFTWVYENAAVARMNGTDPSAVIGRRLLDLFPGHAGSPFFKAYQQVAETGQSRVVEAFYDGETIPTPTWFRVAVVPMGENIAILAQDITEHKRTEEALRRSEEKYRDLIKYAPTGIYEVDFRIPRFSSVNDVMCQYLGYSREELLQMNPSDIMDKRNAFLFRERIQRQLNGEKIDESVEYKVRAKDGREYYALLNITFTYEDGKPKGAMVIAHDITERKQAEEKLRESENRLRRLYESDMLGVIYWNMEGKITDANDKFLEMVGHTRDELNAGQVDWKRMTPVEYRQRDEQSMAELKATGVNRIPFEKEYIRKDGTRVPIILAGAMLDDTCFNGVGFVLDITERKQAEEALKKAYEEMEKRVQERTLELAETVERLRLDNLQRKWLEETLRESEKSVRFFASQCLTAQETERKRIAGELHDSIAASIAAAKFKIENIAEQMKQGNGGPDSLDDVSSRLMEINNEVRRIMADLRPSILDDLGVIPAIDWFCREYQKIYSHLSVDHHIAVSEDEVPDSLKTPIFRISQEAMNNIAKHSQASHVNLSLLRESNKVVLKIQDNGQGFDLDTSKRGMGLSTMKERAQFSGGSFELESKTGKGTTVRAVWNI